ncbi:MAG: hypothetical protein WA081_17370 [Desulfosalsimonadaceae bacterium]
MEVKHTCRIPKIFDDAISKIVISKNTTKNKALNEIIQLGLEAYFKKNEPSGSEKIEKSLSLKFDEIQEKLGSLSDQVKDVDLKSYRLNLFMTEFVNVYFDNHDKFISFNNGVLSKLEEYKNQIKFIPQFGFVVLKYMKNILNKDIPDQFYSEVQKIYLAMKNKE